MRLPHLRPSDLDDDQRALYEVLTTGPRQQAHATLPLAAQLTDGEGRLRGPFNAMLIQPRIGEALQELTRRLRFESRMALRTREIVILIVAAAERSDFEWTAHAPLAERYGVAAADIDAIGRGETVTFDDPTDDAAARFAYAIVAKGDLDDATYAGVRAVLNDAEIYEVSTTIGCYQLIAQQLRVFRVDSPPGPWGA